jgi:hypothetical protein
MPTLDEARAKVALANRILAHEGVLSDCLKLIDIVRGAGPRIAARRSDTCNGPSCPALQL